ncbi:MAG: hypothetical protein JXM79_06190, partial [Sedimentisphaerales bacterium]|nr:hypothetical protein [Sedimentisphaerales bacterium]
MCRWVLLTVTGIAVFIACMALADEAAGSKAPTFERADAETIRMHVRQILSEPDFAPRKTFWQWLSGKFSKWEKPDLHVGSGVATIIRSIVIIWALLTLVAILIHAIWTLRVLIWPGAIRRSDPGKPGSEAVTITSFDELYKMAQALAEKEAFYDAISVLMVAMLRLLDSIGTLHFHESKTNGDYVREYPSG